MELGVKLGANEKRMVADLYDFNEAFGLRNSADFEARGFNLLAVSRIELIAVSVALADDVFPVELVGYGIG